ncbi:MAG: peptidylprolyl isomerase [Oscillospiraceae bacterium]|nr:peptidylprolyl isomerase [Oscillospiraceae bacterium]
MRNQLAALLLCVLLAMGLTACGSDGPEPHAETAETTEATIPATVPADGNPEDVTCRGSYSADDDAIAAAADIVVASMEGANLTNSQLQIYYWLEVADHRMSDHPQQPDYSRSLDTQTCPLDTGVNSWQQYFLDRALTAWHAHQALVLMSEAEGVPTEEAYKPDLEKHAEYMTGMPATTYLYGWEKSYSPNRLHQAYLDSVPDLLNTLASDNGFADNDAQARAIAGAGASGRDLISYTHTANLAYMYFTEMGYHFEPTAEDIEAWYRENSALCPGAAEKTVDIRHILMIPDGVCAADGTVTAGDDAWNACLEQAEELVTQWQTAVKKTRFAKYIPDQVAEARFSEFAKKNSQDPGSSLIGGLYANIRQGQLAPELDAWCFEDARQYGDSAVIRSSAGYHILFFAGSTEGWQTEAEAGLLARMYTDLVTDAMARYPMDADYSLIRLGQAEDNGSFVTASDLLYPDVAHERFPDMPLYLQQDYPEAMYGDYKLSSHGCGITTLAMLASYMTDQELTPPELAARYGYYCGVRGTEIVLFDNTPAEMGFHLVKRSYNWEEMDAALKNGQVVVSLQTAGYWTRGGHYLAMIALNEDGRYVVRDSNLYNYKRISAHEGDSHTRGSISPASQYYWIYEKKVTSIPTCTRCGSGQTGAPEILFRSAYHCEKCLAAMNRRGNFLTGISG